MYVEQQPGVRRAVGRARRHWRWARDEGLRRLADEDGLHPLVRVASAARRRRWIRRNGVEAGSATPVFVLGVQRSGTNMVMRGLGASPLVEVRNESDRRAFHRYRLRPDEVVRSLVASSRSPFVVLKPLCDSHRANELLDGLAGGRGRALWVYRSVDARARSAVAKFGDVNRRVLVDIATGAADGMWQRSGLSSSSMDLIASLDLARLGRHEAAAAFWLVRNRLYFELGLNRRADVMLVRYEGLVASPELEMGAVCSFLGLPYEWRMVEHVIPHVVPRRELRLPAALRRACDELEARLEAAEAAGRARGA